MRKNTVFCETCLSFSLEDSFQGVISKIVRSIVSLSTSNIQNSMLKKRFHKEEGLVEVEFFLPEVLAENADEVLLVGDFNGWDKTGKQRILMEREGNTYRTKLLLEMNREYQYLYVIYTRNAAQKKIEKWEIDWNADKYKPAPLGGGNSVVITYDFSNKQT